MSDIDPKLLKIVALAKQGIGGEKDAAIALVRKICTRENIDFDELMSEDTEQYKRYELHIKWRTIDEEDMLAQVCFRFAVTKDHDDLRFNRKLKYFIYTTTAAKHIETLNAAHIYLREYRKVRKQMIEEIRSAFVQRNRLFSQYDSDDEPQEMKLPTADELRRAERVMMMAADMPHVQIQKQIGGQ